MIRRLLLTALALALTAGVLTGCAELPRPVAAVEPPRPAMTVAEATAIHATLAATITKADATHSPTTAGQVLGGLELRGRTADYDKQVRWGQRPLAFELGGTVMAVSSLAADGYPRRALVVSTRKPSKSDPEDRLVEVFERADAAAPWRRLVGVPVRARELPALATDAAGICTPAPAKVNGFTVAGGTAVAAAVADPNRYRTRFATSSSLRFFRQHLDRRQSSKHQRWSQSVRALPEQFAFPTRDGGVLVVSTIRVRLERKMADGWYFYYTKGAPMRKAYPGNYVGSGETSDAAFLLHVPPTGTIATPGTNWWTDITLTEQPD